MFSRVTSIVLPGSPTFQSNNLSSHSDLICFTRLSEVSIVDDNKFLKISLTRSQLSEASIHTIGNEACIVVASNLGVQCWSLNGESMLFFHSTGESDTYFRGVTSLANCVCVGTSTGSILVFRFNAAESLSTGHTSTTTLEPLFDFSVTALASSETVLCGGNENGDIFVYDTDFSVDFRFVCKFPGDGSPCTAIACQPLTSTVFAGFSTGHIRVYRPNIGEMCMEITAHVRTVTGIVVHPSSAFYATCGEDQFFQVWRVPDFTNPEYVEEIKKECLLFCDKIENRLCTGVCFLSADRIAVASYDDENLIVFQKN